MIVCSQETRLFLNCSDSIRYNLNYISNSLIDKRNISRRILALKILFSSSTADWMASFAGQVLFISQ